LRRCLDDADAVLGGGPTSLNGIVGPDGLKDPANTYLAQTANPGLPMFGFRGYD